MPGCSGRNSRRENAVIRIKVIRSEYGNAHVEMSLNTVDKTLTLTLNGVVYNFPTEIVGDDDLEDTIRAIKEAAAHL